MDFHKVTYNEDVWLTFRRSVQKYKTPLIIFLSLLSLTSPLPGNFYSTKLLVAF